MIIYKEEYKILLPKMIEVKQEFQKYLIDNIINSLLTQLSQKAISSKIKPGMSIVIGIGSRGISHILEITKILIDQLKNTVLTYLLLLPWKFMVVLLLTGKLQY